MSIAQTRALMAKMREEEEAKRREGDLGSKLMRAAPAALIGAATGGLGAAALPMIGLGAAGAGISPTAISAGLAAGQKAFNTADSDPGSVGIGEALNVVGQDVSRETEKIVADKLGGMIPKTMTGGKVSYSVPTIKTKPTKGIVKEPGQTPSMAPPSGYEYGITGETADGKVIWELKKVSGSGNKPAVSLGRLSKSASNAFASAQSVLARGMSRDKVIAAIEMATDIPAEEKPILIKNLPNPTKSLTRKSGSEF